MTLGALPFEPDELESSPAITTAPRQNRGDRFFFGVLGGAALVGPVLLAALIAVLLYGAWPAMERFGFSFITSNVWEPNPAREQYGAFPFIVGTLVSSLLALCVAGPVGVAVATFIGEVVPGRVAGALRFLIEILATVPSVVYGLWGVFVMAPWIDSWLKPPIAATLGFLPIFGEPHDPRNMLCAVLILSVMILPMIVSVSLDAIRAVPSLQREAALGLGATRWEMIRVAVWPSARVGFVGGSILALGRALGETMAVTMVIGNARRISASLFAASDTVASTIANQFAEAPSDLFTASLIEMALLLLAVTLVVNVGARLLIRRFAPDTGVRQ
jgi:phosphate transport system permease protein